MSGGNSSFFSVPAIIEPLSAQGSAAATVAGAWGKKAERSISSIKQIVPRHYKQVCMSTHMGVRAYFYPYVAMHVFNMYPSYLPIY